MKLIAASIALLFSTVTAMAGVSVPPKFTDASLSRRAEVSSYFSADQIQNLDYVRAKKTEWQACHRKPNKNLLEGANDPVRKFLAMEEVVTSLTAMEAKNLQSAELSTHPWSGDYWPYASGVIANRFMDFKFNMLESWKDRYDYVLKYPASEILRTQDAKKINRLSPAEKYALLVGDQDFHFADAMWVAGKRYYDEQGDVEGWMGICHGWAPAAIMEPRPLHSVVVPSFDKKSMIRLNPSELKGLASYSWANNSYSEVMLGERCNDKDPKTDKHGRLVNSECFDLNPATWHIAVVNMIGVKDHSFVMDATYDYEVWNQPVVNYSYSYYNPVTGNQTETLSDAVVARADFKKDPYAKHRSPKAASLVGVTMKVGYVVERGASMDDYDSEKDDLIQWVKYDYDLELDAKGEIIGGEWHIVAHPDFIWVPQKNARPQSYMDHSLQTAEWQIPETVPADWAEAARSGVNDGTILNAITESLLRKASY